MTIFDDIPNPPIFFGAFFWSSGNPDIYIYVYQGSHSAPNCSTFSKMCSKKKSGAESGAESGAVGAESGAVGACDENDFLFAYGHTTCPTKAYYMEI